MGVMAIGFAFVAAVVVMAAVVVIAIGLLIGSVVVDIVFLLTPIKL